MSVIIKLVNVGEQFRFISKEPTSNIEEILSKEELIFLDKILTKIEDKINA